MRDRIRVEEALRESEEKYRTILNSIQEGYYEIDLRGDLMFCNDSLCGIIGYPRDELIGMNNRQYMPAEAAKRAYEMFLRVYDTGEATEAFDWEVITKDGTRENRGGLADVDARRERRPRRVPGGGARHHRTQADGSAGQGPSATDDAGQQDGRPRGPGLGGGPRDQQPQQLHHAERPHPAGRLESALPILEDVLQGERRFSDGRHEVLGDATAHAQAPVRGHRTGPSASSRSSPTSRPTCAGTPTT